MHDSGPWWTRGVFDTHSKWSFRALVKYLVTTPLLNMSLSETCRTRTSWNSGLAKNDYLFYVLRGGEDTVRE